MGFPIFSYEFNNRFRIDLVSEAFLDSFQSFFELFLLQFLDAFFQHFPNRIADVDVVFL